MFEFSDTLRAARVQLGALRTARGLRARPPRQMKRPAGRTRRVSLTRESQDPQHSSLLCTEEPGRPSDRTEKSDVSSSTCGGGRSDRPGPRDGLERTAGRPHQGKTGPRGLPREPAASVAPPAFTADGDFSPLSCLARRLSTSPHRLSSRSRRSTEREPAPIRAKSGNPERRTCPDPGSASGANRARTDRPSPPCGCPRSWSTGSRPS